MSSQPSHTTVAEAVKQGDPSNEISDAERLKELSAHWNSLKDPRPKPGGYHRGIYIPPNGPPGTFYIGYGTVVETGLNSQGGIYVWVMPPASEECKRSKLYQFRNPLNKERDCLDPDHRPINPAHYDMIDYGSRWWPPAVPPPNLEELEKRMGAVSVGDEGVGIYRSYTQQHYKGLGRVVQDSNVEGEPRWLEEVHVIPIPGRQGSGDYRFFRTFSEDEIPYMELPSPVKLTSAQRKRWRRSIRNRKPGHSSGFGEKNSGPRPGFPELGAEARGAYLAPDGQWYSGRGKAVAFGIGNYAREYTLVEPIPGKEGGEYDFFHPVTKEYMPKFPDFPTAAHIYPWREHFKRPLSELVPGLEDAFVEGEGEARR
jgi:hypothetical protein